MHLGHQAILKQLLERARQDHLISVILLFEPQAREWLDPETAPARLMRLRDKGEYLRAAGLAVLFCCRFNQALAQTSAEHFVEQILLQQLRLKTLIVGDDFRFGYRRRGDIALLQSLGEKHGFEVLRIPSCVQGGERVSSTRVRKALEEGDMEGAQRLLGRPFSCSGRVLHGLRRGHRLGFPTANMAIHRRSCGLPSGVFLSRTWVQDSCLDSVSYIGRRPVFGAGELQLETHLLACRESLYGQRIKVELLSRLRGELSLCGASELVRQMKQDIAAARQYHEAYRLPSDRTA